MRHNFAYKFVRGPGGTGESDRHASLTWSQVAEAYEAITGERMTGHYAEKVARKAMVKLRKRLAEKGINCTDDLMEV